MLRILPPDTLGVPESVPVINGEYPFDCCRADIDDPRGESTAPGDGWYCTQPPHGDDKMHICHVRDDVPPYRVVEIAVWGGE